jgi:protein-tyrosine phosphatase
VHVLFICTGNICRSPTAERLALVYNSDLPIPGFISSSAGTHALVGSPMHPDAATALQRLGGDPSNFVARRVSEKLVSNVDLVLTMTKQHRDDFLEVAPRHLHRTFTLSEASQLCTKFEPEKLADLRRLRPLQMADDYDDIEDPIGQDMQFFERTAMQITKLLPPVLELCRRST